MTLIPNTQTLVMFAHPLCPCTQASVSELERVLVHAPSSTQCRILFVHPGREQPGWGRSDLWDRAASIPGAIVESDVLGIEARRFHVGTSGHVLLYDASGMLLFSGGITGLRAHEGDNFGKTALLDRLFGRVHEFEQAEVFGCPLFEPAGLPAQMPQS